jgi:hypothetical protein
MAFTLFYNKLPLKLLSSVADAEFSKKGTRLDLKKKVPYILQVDKQKKKVLIPKGERNPLPYHPWILP